MKYEARNLKSQTSTKSEDQNSKQYDLEERTLAFSKQVIDLCNGLPRSTANKRLSDQLIRSSTSIGANYREANETDTKRDFRNRIRICKKEAKETIYWTKLLSHTNKSYTSRITPLLKEAFELMKILGAIYRKSR